MGFVGDLLGGSEGTPGQVLNLTPEAFQQLAGPVSTELKKLFSSGGGEQFTGEFAAPVTGGENDLLARISAMFESPSAFTTGAGDLLTRTLSGDASNTNPFLQSAIEAATRPAISAFNENVLPALRVGFTQAGQQVQDSGSSPFVREVRRAGTDLTNTVGDIASKLSFGSFESERARQQEALGIANEFRGTEIGNQIQALQAQALPRLIEQLGLDRGLAEFRRRIDVVVQALGLGTAAAGAPPAAIEGTAGTSGADIGGILSGGAALISASDRRMKENIHHISTMPVTGLPVYEFTYKGGDEVHVGVMADEVVKELPAAVIIHNGLSFVDYGMLLSLEGRI